MLTQVDVVHTHAPYLRAANLAARTTLAAGKPLFYSPCGSYHPVMLREAWLKKMIYIALVEKPVMRRATGIIAVSQREVESVSALCETACCHIVPNGIDVTQFRRAPRTNSLQRFGIAPHHKVVLFLGRVRASKGAPLLLQAFLRIARINPDAMLVMAGPDEQRLVRAMRDRVHQHGLQERVVFPGFVAGEERLDLLARADLFVLPSQSEGQSMAVLEALASGTPVLLSSACDFDIAAANGAGWICDLDVESLAADLSRLIGNPPLLATAGHRAFELARDQLGWGPVVARLEELYSSGLPPNCGKTRAIARGP